MAQRDADDHAAALRRQVLVAPGRFPLLRGVKQRIARQIAADERRCDGRLRTGEPAALDDAVGTDHIDRKKLLALTNQRLQGVSDDFR